MPGTVWFRHMSVVGTPVRCGTLPGTSAGPMVAITRSAMVIVSRRRRRHRAAVSLVVMILSGLALWHGMIPARARAQPLLPAAVMFLVMAVVIALRLLMLRLLSAGARVLLAFLIARRFCRPRRRPAAALA